MTGWISVNGLRFHTWQDGAGSDVVLIHGLGANLAQWHFTIAAGLLPHHRLTMYDLRGHGRSERPPSGYALADMAGDLAGVINALSLNRVSLVGHSFGADIALYFAGLHPQAVRAIAAIEASAPALLGMRNDRGWRGWEEWRDVLRREGAVEWPVDAWQSIYARLAGGEPVPELQAADVARSRRARGLLDLFVSTTLIQDYEVGSRGTGRLLRRVRCPVLLVYGAGSSYLPAAPVLSRRLRRASVVHVPDAEHFDVLLRTQELLPLLQQFLSTPPPQIGSNRADPSPAPV